MAEFFIRSGGQVYGPYSQQQFQSFVDSGRVTPTTEVSTDRVNWRPFAGAQGAAPARAQGPRRGTADVYLANLRGRTNYPLYRAVVTLSTVLGLVAAALPSILHVVNIVRLGVERTLQQYDGQEWMIVAPFFISALIAVGVKLCQELANMFVDFVDSTIDHHSQRSQD